MVQNQLLLSRARSATLARDFDLATRLYRQLLRKDRNNVELLKQLGNLYMKSGRDDLALPVFKNIVELSKDDFDSLITLGGIYRRLKMYEDSIAILEQALIFDSNNPQVSYNLGFTYKIMGDTENAIECFEDTIEMNPEDVLAYNHLGTIYAQKNEHEKAVQWYLRGLNVDTNHPVLLLNIAKSYEELGDYKKACEAYSRALRSKPLWTDAVGGFSRLLVKINRAPEAHELVKRALSVNPNDEILEENLKYVEKFVEKSKDDENLNENKIQPENQESASVELNLNGEKSDFEEENSDEENAGIQAEIESEQIEENLSEEKTEDETFAEAEDEEDENEENSSLDELKLGDDENFDFETFGQENFEDLEDEYIPELEEDEPELTEEKQNLSEEIPQKIQQTADLKPSEPLASEKLPELESFGGETQNLPELESFDGETQNLPELESFGGEKQNLPELENFDGETQNLPDGISVFSQDIKAFESFDFLEPELVEELPQNPNLALFIKLRELLEFLPEEKKREFQTSETRILLDFVISRLSGEKGLFEKANELIKSGFVQPSRQKIGQNSSSRQLLSDGFEIVKELLNKIPDKNLVYAMENLLKKIPF